MDTSKVDHPMIWCVVGLHWGRWWWGSLVEELDNEDVKHSRPIWRGGVELTERYMEILLIVFLEFNITPWKVPVRNTVHANHSGSLKISRLPKLTVSNYCGNWAGLYSSTDDICLLWVAARWRYKTDHPCCVLGRAGSRSQWLFLYNKCAVRVWQDVPSWVNPTIGTVHAIR